MLFNLPLKQTRQVDLLKPVEQAILNCYGEAKLFTEIRDVVEKTQKLRQHLDYEKINLSIATDPLTSENLENNLIEYLKHFSLLFKHLRFEQGDQRSPQVMFYWSDSYDHKRSCQLNQGRLELISQYYNLAISYYYQANSKMIKDTDPDRKAAYTKLRNGLWAFDQLKQHIHGLSKDSISQLYDITTLNLEFLEHAYCGLSYKALYQNMMSQVKTFGLNIVCGTIFEAAKEFTISLKAVEAMNSQYQKQVGKNFLAQILPMIQFNQIWATVTGCIQMGVYHYGRIPDDSRGQNMGKALGFLIRAQQLLQPVVNDKNSSKTYSPDQLDQLKQLNQQLTQLSTEYNYKNQQIYKEQIVAQDLLPYPPLMEQIRIKPLEPVNFKESVQGANKFSGFVSEEALQLSREIKMFVEQTKYSLEESLRQLFSQKNQAYAEAFLTYFIDMAQQKQLVSGGIPQSIQDKIAYIRSRGCLSGIEKIVEQGKQKSIICNQLLGQIEQELLNEQQQDQQNRNKYGAKWARTPSSQLNQQYFNSLKDLKAKYLQAQGIDFNVMSGFENSKEAIILAAQNDNQIIEKLPKDNNNSDFVNQNAQTFAQLTSLDQKVNTIIDQLKATIQEYTQIIQETNFTKIAVNGINDGLPKEQVFTIALQTVSALIENFNNNMNSVSEVITQICGIAKQLSNLKKQSVEQVQQSGQTNIFANAQSAIDNIDHSVVFYEQLKMHLEDQDRKVKDFLMARNIESEQLIQQLNQQQTYQQSQQNQAQYQQPQQPQQQAGYQYPVYPQYPQQPQQPNPQYPQQPNPNYPQGYPPQQYPQQQQPYVQYPQQNQGAWGQQYKK
ncbi:unnamed protein product (macronuclear) [Paramecium tetraurelia]|uniref:BRO1 domain-containing protein n=1 Tax=Paramecium tetraurelia TaxID=5888 RepID=A0DFK8_PARTE|nr:uncharacterized protein GSPATT00016638001 [Paramecium tetraurelia]CAK81825.1 unnamed protein product [Paramecium tetraurelia]|eukprot:XP_001449222.1 hypothetical protein (macronuclear) [Paramecium tetraurelia strain d4-2]